MTYSTQYSTKNVTAAKCTFLSAIKVQRGFVPITMIASAFDVLCKLGVSPVQSRHTLTHACVNNSLALMLVAGLTATRGNTCVPLCQGGSVLQINSEYLRLGPYTVFY